MQLSFEHTDRVQTHSYSCVHYTLPAKYTKSQSSSRRATRRQQSLENVHQHKNRYTYLHTHNNIKNVTFRKIKPATDIQPCTLLYNIFYLCDVNMHVLEIWLNNVHDMHRVCDIPTYATCGCSACGRVPVWLSSCLSTALYDAHTYKSTLRTAQWNMRVSCLYTFCTNMK